MPDYKIRYQDIPEQYCDIVQLLGLEQFLSLCSLCGGGLVYLPTIKSLAIESRNREIYERFTGCNYKQLAIQYSLSERRVRKIIEQQKNTEKDGET